MVQYRPAPLDRVFHALAHPARRAILRCLADREQSLSELAAPLKMSFPAVSKHVRVLEQARLLRRRIVGRTHICRAQGQPLAQANQWLEECRRNWERNFLRLDALLDQMKAHERDEPTTSQTAERPKPDGDEPCRPPPR
jgi:DNA-binding transcriptional ArsR family regulator